MEALKAMKQNPCFKRPQNFWFAAQICLRFLATVATLAAACTVLTSKQSIVRFGITSESRYSYSPAFKLFAIANVVGCSISALFLFITFILGQKVFDLKRYFYVFLGDLMITILLIAGCAAATAIGYVGRYGNDRAGWVPFCGNFEKLCNKITISLMLSYFGAILHLLLTIISANNCRQFLLEVEEIKV